MGRKYELKRRATTQARTRRRIVQAAVALHTTIGPVRTTVSAIAERAGVQVGQALEHRQAGAHRYEVDAITASTGG